MRSFVPGTLNAALVSAQRFRRPAFTPPTITHPQEDPTMTSTSEPELKEILRLNALEAGQNMYNMDEQGITFIKAQTGIEDEEELKKHILAVRAEGYAVRLRSTEASLTPMLTVAARHVFLLDLSLPMPSTLFLPPVSWLAGHRPAMKVKSNGYR